MLSGRELFSHTLALTSGKKGLPGSCSADKTDSCESRNLLVRPPFLSWAITLSSAVSEMLSDRTSPIDARGELCILAYAKFICGETTGSER
jgi:hypothetical protein